MSDFVRLRLLVVSIENFWDVGVISRRRLVKVSLVGSGSLVVQIPLSAKASSRLVRCGEYFDAWLEIARENALRFSLDKVEMGQRGVNSLVVILAEEINNDPLMIEVQLPVIESTGELPSHILLHNLSEH